MPLSQINHKNKLISEKAKKNLKLGEGLFNFAYKAKSFQLRKKYPQWDEEKVHQRTMELIERGCS